MKRNIMSVCAIIGTFAAIGSYMMCRHETTEDSNLIIANVEALTASENDATNAIWIIHPYDCTISAEIAAKLGIKVKADGTAHVSGARDCSTGGKFLCTPISCVDVYRSLGLSAE